MERWMYLGGFSCVTTMAVVTSYVYWTELPRILTVPSQGQRAPIAHSNSFSREYETVSNGGNTTYNITIHAAGRLGNNMFEFASLLGIGKSNGLNVILPPELLSLFDVFTLQRTAWHVQWTALDTNYTSMSEPSPLSYDTRTARISSHLKHDTNVRLLGFYQSYRYFQGFVADVRRCFTFQSHILDEVDEFMASHTPDHLIHTRLTYIGIHIRWGDFLSAEHVYRGLEAAPEAYIVRAKEYMRRLYQDVLFIAASDGMNWITSNITDDNTIVSTFKDAWLDLALLSRCNHSIISTGSFSWWAGWLANGTTIYYENYPRPGSGLAKRFNKSDYYPADWVPMT